MAEVGEAPGVRDRGDRAARSGGGEILARLIELKIIDPTPVPEFRLRGVESYLKSTIGGHEDGHAQPPT